jgi:hypothetical protein
VVGAPERHRYGHYHRYHHHHHYNH